MNRKNDVLAIDVGNTSVLVSQFTGHKIVKSRRIPTNILDVDAIIAFKKLFSLRYVEAAVIACVVPRTGALLQKLIPKKLGITAYTIGKDFGVPIKNLYKDPGQVGIDRLVNAAAAYHRYHRDAIIIDFGTAITFDVITRDGGYLGGVIAPGIEISLEALYHKTALLPKIQLAHPASLIGRDTVESIRVGCSVGIGGLCDRLTHQIIKKYRLDPVIIATGGYAKFMRRYCENIDKIIPYLTMDGIYLSYKKFLTMNRKSL